MNILIFREEIEISRFKEENIDPFGYIYIEKERESKGWSFQRNHCLVSTEQLA